MDVLSIVAAAMIAGSVYAIGNSIVNSLDNQKRIKVLELVLIHGTEEDKEKAKKELAEIFQQEE